MRMADPHEYPLEFGGMLPAHWGGDMNASSDTHAPVDFHTPDSAPPERLHRGFFSDRLRSDAEVEQAMIDAFERVLEHPVRKQFPAGAILLREGDALERIFIRLSGGVSLIRQVAGQDLVFHTHTVGRIIGLMSLSDRHRALFTCRADTPVEVIEITIHALDDALQRSPELSIHFTTVLLRSLATRNRRAAELRLEVLELNHALSRERDQLAATLEQLKGAHLRLVETEKMATLGQLTAGLAHELNNPVAAIIRAADYLEEDILALSAAPGHDTALPMVLRRARDAAPLSTREIRARRAAWMPIVNDAALATRLTDFGFQTRAEAEAELGPLERPEARQRLAELEHYHRIGGALRNMHTCAERIAALVATLRSYSRAGTAMQDGIDVRKELDDTLSLFGHALRELDVQRDYQDVPPIMGTPGELNQIWTNLIDNAIQAMEGKGTLRLSTTRWDADHIEVAVIDSGRGIPPENRTRIFDMHFTTKAGRVEFGIGLGLAICRRIADRHGGAIEVESRPGHTAFRVRLPIRQPEPPPTVD